MFQQLLVDQKNMSNLTCASGEASANSSGNNRTEIGTNYSQQHFVSPQTQTHDEPTPAKKKRNLPGNPDPEAEVIALSPKTLMATNRFICEICNKGFQRDQNLQLHRRGHNLPWKLKQRTSNEIIRKKVYVCPETTCVHHDPSRALGDLTGIKKHFCRKHGEKKWKCDKCSKKYAVRSDWKAHSKTCGTREYRCDCGTLFSRRDSFITHRAFCDALAAEESAIRSNSNPLVLPPSSPSPQQAPPNYHHHHQNQDNIHIGFPLKKEQQNFTFLRQQIPPWIDLSSSSPSTSMFSSYENPNPRSVGPTSFPGYQQGASAAHMSATALLQKAAQMGATMTKTGTEMRTHHDHHAHVSVVANADLSNFGLNNLSSCEEQMNKAGGSGVGGTRDFLGLRPLFSPSDMILTIAGMGNCMNSSSNHQQN